MRILERWSFWIVLKLEINYRVIISWRILISFRGFFEDYIFAWWLSFTILLFLIWKNFFLKFSNISENNIISVKLAEELGYMTYTSSSKRKWGCMWAKKKTCLSTWGQKSRRALGGYLILLITTSQSLFLGHICESSSPSRKYSLKK